MRLGSAHALINNQLRRIRSLTLVFLLAVSTIPSELFADNHNHEERYGGTLRLGLGSEYGGIHPYTTMGGVGRLADGIIHLGLFKVRFDNSIEPFVAESWECNEKESYCDIKIRNDIYFHDGENLTVDDIIFSYDLARKFDLEWLKSIFETLEDYEALGTYKIRMHYKSTLDMFLPYIDVEILPKHIYDKAHFTEEYYEKNIVGVGPFVYERRDEDNNIHLTAYKNYHLGRPYFDNLLLKTYADNNDVWGAMLKGDIDVAVYLRPEDIGILDDDLSFKVVKSPMKSNSIIFFNYSKDLSRDIRFRKVISYVIDRKRIESELLHGYGELNFSVFDSAREFARDFTDEYSPEKARALLLEMGYSFDERKNVWLKDNEILEFKILVFNEFKHDARLAMMLRQNLARFGIRLRVVKISMASYDKIVNKNVDGIITSRGWIYNSDFIVYSKNSAQFLERYGITDYLQEIPGWLTKYKENINNPDKLVELERDLQKVLIDNYYFTYLYTTPSLHAIKSDLQNIEKIFEEDDYTGLTNAYRHN